EQLRLSEGFFCIEVELVVSEISFDSADVAVQLFEELVGERLFVECFVADAAEFECADVRASIEVELGQSLRSGAVAFARPDAEAAENEALAGVITEGRAADLRVNEMDTRTALMAKCVPAGEKKERGGEAFAELQNQGALD